MELRKSLPPFKDFRPEGRAAVYREVEVKFLDLSLICDPHQTAVQCISALSLLPNNYF